MLEQLKIQDIRPVKVISFRVPFLLELLRVFGFILPLCAVSISAGFFLAGLSDGLYRPFIYSAIVATIIGLSLGLFLKVLKWRIGLLTKLSSVVIMLALPLSFFATRFYSHEDILDKMHEHNKLGVESLLSELGTHKKTQKDLLVWMQAKNLQDNRRHHRFVNYLMLNLEYGLPLIKSGPLKIKAEGISAYIILLADLFFGMWLLLLMARVFDDLFEKRRWAHDDPQVVGHFMLMHKDLNGQFVQGRLSQLWRFKPSQQDGEAFIIGEEIDSAKNGKRKYELSLYLRASNSGASELRGKRLSKMTYPIEARAQIRKLFDFYAHELSGKPKLVNKKCLTYLEGTLDEVLPIINGGQWRQIAPFLTAKGQTKLALEQTMVSKSSARGKAYLELVEERKNEHGHAEWQVLIRKEVSSRDLSQIRAQIY